MQDKISYKSGASSGAVVGIVGAQVIAVSDANYRRYLDSGGSYRQIFANPGIVGSAALQFGIQVLTDGTGTFSLYLPQSGSSHPAQPTAQWTILLPSGVQLTGVVPAQAGPLLLDDLVTTYGWTVSNAIYVAPVTPGTLAEGTAVFTAAAYVDIVFAAPFAANTYRVTFGASADSGTGNGPSPFWSNKTTSGFRINASGVFTGSIDWSAKL